MYLHQKKVHRLSEIQIYLVVLYHAEVIPGFAKVPEL